MINDIVLNGQVSVDRLPQFRKAIERLNKRLEKRGFQPYRLAIGEPRTEWIEEAPNGKEEPRGYFFNLVDVTVRGTQFALGAYRLGAIIDHRESPARISSFGDFKVPQKFFEAHGHHCDHCHTNRDRARTFLLKDPGGNISQVGQSCLEEFTGVSPSALLNAAGVVRELEGLLDDEVQHCQPSHGGHTLHFEPSVRLEEYLPFVASAIRLYGWTSRSTFHDRIGYGLSCASPTADIAWDNYYASHNLNREVEVTPEDRVVAHQALAWSLERLENSPELPGIEATMGKMAKAGRVTETMLGIAAYMVQDYLKTIHHKREQGLISPDSVYVGEKGKRENFILTVARVVNKESAFGTKHIHTLADDDGNAFVWYGTAAPLNPGSRYEVKATVEGHSEYQGIKQTILKRVAVVKELEATAEAESADEDEFALAPV